MEVDGNDKDTVQGLISKDVDKKTSRAKAKEKKEKRKSPSGGGKNHPQGPTKTGQNGARDTASAGKGAHSGSRKKLSKNSSEQEERGCSPKRKPPKDFHHYAGEDSYHKHGRVRSKSRPRHDKEDHNPRSILKKNVRFQGRGRGRGGRSGRGGRGS